MSLMTNLIKWLILAAALAAYNVYFRHIYESYVGKPLGFGEEMLGYFLAIFGSYIVAWLVIKRMRSDEE